MAGNWNPNAPGVLGLEWLGAYPYNDRQLASGGSRKVTRIHSYTAEQIEHLAWGRGPRKAGASPLTALIEVFEEANLLVTAPVVNKYPPDAHGTGTGIGNWTTQTGSTSNLHLAIDEAVVYPPSILDYIRTRGAISNVFFHMNTGAFPLTSRVGRLRLRAVSSANCCWRDVYYRLYHVPTATTFIPPGDKIRTHNYGTLNEIDLGEINPATLRPWSPADVRGFEAANNIWQVRITGAGSTSNELRVYSLELEVYSAPENRVAVSPWYRPAATQDFPSAGFTGTDEIVHLDTGTGNWVTGWAKPAAKDHVYLVRRAADRMVAGGGAVASDVSWHHVGGASAEGTVFPPDPFMRSADVTFWPDATLPGAVQTVTPFTGHLVGTMIPFITGFAGDVSNDSQPYILESEGAVGVGAGYTLDISDTEYVGQTMRASATRSYLGIRTIVKPPTDGEGTMRLTVHGPIPTGFDITLADPQVGGTFDIAAADALSQPAVPNMPGFRDVRGFLSFAAPLVSGSTYYVRFDKMSGTVGTVWNIVQFEAEEHSDASFQGSVPGFNFTQNKGTGVESFTNEEDVAVLLYEQPPPPTGVGTAVVSDPQVFLYDNCIISGAPCDVPFIDGVQITWGVPTTGYGPSFDHWDIERQDYGDPVWYRIAQGSSEAVRSYTDYEAVRNRPSQYRVRAVKMDESFTAWVEAPASVLTVAGVAGGAASTPDRASFAVTDIDIAMQLADSDWTPGGFGQFLVGQWESVAGQNGWVLGITAAGNLFLSFTTDGTTAITRTSTAVLPFVNGEPKWVRATLDADNGSAQHVVTFYTSDDGVSWTPFGNPVTTAGTIALFNVTIPLRIAQALPAVGEVWKVVWRSTINGATIIANPDFTTLPVGTTTFIDDAGNVWTLGPAGTITAFSWPKTYDAEVIFASSARPDLNVAYTYDPDVPVEFLDHENDELMVVQGAPFRVAFLDPFDRGMEIQYRISPVFGFKPVDGENFQLPIERVFAPLSDIARSRGGDLMPYVCVLDYEGGRRFAYIRLDNGSRQMPLFRYFVTVTAIPLTNTPAVVEF